MITSKFFNMGQIVATRSVSDYMSADRKFATEINLCLRRFAVKDFGNLDKEDKQKNKAALNYPDDLHLLGVYQTCKGRILITCNRISEKAGDNITIVLFPK